MWHTVVEIYHVQLLHKQKTAFYYSWFIGKLCLKMHLSCLVFRAAETSQDVASLRPPRFIHEDGVIRPYKEREGIGSQMLQVRRIIISSPQTDLGK